MKNRLFFTTLLIFSLVIAVLPSSQLLAQRVIDLSLVEPHFKILGDDNGDNAGFSLAEGHIDGDNFFDLIIGAYKADPSGRTDAGEVYVFFGEEGPPATWDLSTTPPDMVIYGESAGDQCGYAVACGDINSDMYDDIIIGAPMADSGKGKVYVIFGSAIPPSTYDLKTTPANITIDGKGAGDNLGHALASVDFNGNGYNDIIIGAPYGDPTPPPPASALVRTDAGTVYIIFGSYTPPSTIDLSTTDADITILGENINDNCGWSVGSGQIKQMRGDILIGAPYADPGGRADAGRVYVIYGTASSGSIIDLQSDADTIISGAAAGDNLGWAVEIGDANGDSYGELLMGAPCADPSARSDAGTVYVVFGSSISLPSSIDFSTTAADVEIYGAIAGDKLGYAISGADVNLDGFGDGIFGAPYASPGGRTSAGEVYVIFGRDTLPATVDLANDSANLTVLGEVAYYQMGSSVLGMDFDGNESGDVFIGAPLASPSGRSGAGEVYGIRGWIDVAFGHGPGGSSWVKDSIIPTYEITSFKAFGAANTSGEVSVAKGDVDGDRSPEIVVGMRGCNSIVKVFDEDGTFLWKFQAFGIGNPSGKVNVGLADVDLDGKMEIVCGHGPEGSSMVRVFTFDDTTPTWSFKAFGATNTKGEVRVEGGHTNPLSAMGQIVVGQGHGGSSWVKVFDYKNPSAVATIKAFGATNQSGGVDVSVGDVDEDGADEIIVGQGGPGAGELPAGSWVKVFKENGTPVWNFKAFGAKNADGHVTVSCSMFAIVVGQCPSATSGSFAKVFIYPTSSAVETYKIFGAANAQGGIDVAIERKKMAPRP
ncbi:MAG: hypothetical protein OEX80_07115 [Candidatus Aminicenantes bacterium]|nr:hypothetical protein [Candidatus Aminicenantes bacterium]